MSYRLNEKQKKIIYDRKWRKKRKKSVYFLRHPRVKKEMLSGSRDKKKKNFKEKAKRQFLCRSLYMSSQIKWKSNRVKVIQRVTEKKERVRCIECLGVSCGWGCWDLLKRAKVHEETAICGALNVRGQVSVARDMLLFQQPLPESTGSIQMDIDQRASITDDSHQVSLPNPKISKLQRYCSPILFTLSSEAPYSLRLALPITFIVSTFFIYYFSHSISSRLSLFPFSIFLSAFYPSHHFSPAILLTISLFTTRRFHYQFSPLVFTPYFFNQLPTSRYYTL